MARADANAQAVSSTSARRATGSTTSPVDPATRSNTSVCLKFTDPAIADGAAFAKAVAKRLEAEGVALDIGAYRDAPPGLRIWCGATVETSDHRGDAAVARLGLPRPKSSAGKSRLIASWPAGHPRRPGSPISQHQSQWRPSCTRHGPQVLVSDKLSETAVQIFRDRGIDVTFDPDPSARTRTSCSR
jgi:hypothetical protein